MKNKAKYIILGILALLLVGGVSYAFVSFLLNGSTVNNIVSADLIFSYNEKSAALSITSNNAMSDEEGLAQENSFDFDVKGQSGANEVISYAIILEKDPSSTL